MYTFAFEELACVTIQCLHLYLSFVRFEGVGGVGWEVKKSLMINLEPKKPFNLLFGGFFFRIESKLMGEYTPLLCSTLIPGMCNVYTPSYIRGLM